MSGHRRRLQRIELGLTPTQAALLWLREAHQFDSMRAYARWLAGQPDAAAPLPRLQDLIVPAVEHATKGERPIDRAAAVRAALHEVGFLFFLHQQANTRILSEARALRLAVQLLGHDPLHVGRTGPDLAASRLDAWRTHATTTWVELQALTATIQGVSDHHFEGHAVLFADAADVLATCLAMTERAITNHNDFVHYGTHTGVSGELENALVDLEVLAAQVPKAASTLQAELVALATGEIHALMDEPDHAADAVRPLVTAEGA